jgi:hypothetical protein
MEKIILAIAQNNKFPLHIIPTLKKKLITKKTKISNYNNTTYKKIGKIMSQSTNTKNKKKISLKALT